MADAELTPADIRRVAHLARLEVSDAELPVLAARLGAVLTYFERLSRLDLSGVEPLTGATITMGRLAPDQPGPTLSPSVLIAMAPDTMPPFIKVPKVLGEGGGA